MDVVDYEHMELYFLDEEMNSEPREEVRMTQEAHKSFGCGSFILAVIALVFLVQIVQRCTIGF